VVFSRKSFLVLIIFSFLSVASIATLFLFKSDSVVILDSVSSDYAFPSSPDVVTVSGSNFFAPTILNEDSSVVSLLEPSVFNAGFWSIYPVSLEPGFYYVFSGFSQSVFQVHFSLFDSSPSTVINPLFWIFFSFSLVCLFITFILFISVFHKFFKFPTLLIVTVLSFLSVTIVLGFAFFNVSNLTPLESRPPLPYLGTTTHFPEFEDSFSLVTTNASYSLDDLKSLLEKCLRPDRNQASMYSNNTACASSVFTYATKKYGPEGFAYLTSSDFFNFFNELCEFSSRYNAKYALTDPIDVSLIEKGLVCNFSWLNHLLSSDLTSFTDVYSFLDYASKTCVSIESVKNISSDIIRQQCSRGIGVGLFNLTKNTAKASSLCLDLPSVYGPENCAEGVFLEAYNQLSSKKLYNVSSTPYEFICENVDPLLLGSCFRIIDRDLLQSYSIPAFKEYCLSLGVKYEQACAFSAGHLAAQVINVNDFTKLEDYCDFTSFLTCLDRFYATQTVENPDDAFLILDSCFAYVSKFDFESGTCAKLKSFIEDIISVKERG
jgi:hypothetical protein